MAITTSGGVCSTSKSSYFGSTFLNGGKLGFATVGRITTIEDVGVCRRDRHGDYIYRFLLQFRAHVPV